MSLATSLILTVCAIRIGAGAESSADSPSNRVFPYVGVAIAPNGQAANGAQVALLDELSAVITAKAEILSGCISASEDGSFAVMPKVADKTVLIVHELGIAAVPLTGWRDEAKIRLQPWAAPKGRMLINDVPAANKGLVASRMKFHGAHGSAQLLDFETRTDAAGNFHLDRLPPGEITLFWEIPNGL